MAIKNAIKLLMLNLNVFALFLNIITNPYMYLTSTKVAVAVINAFMILIIISIYSSQSIFIVFPTPSKRSLYHFADISNIVYPGSIIFNKNSYNP